MLCHQRIRMTVSLMAAVLLAAGVSLSQFNATLVIQPFPSPYPGDWQTNPTIGYLTINNSSGLPAQVRVSLRFLRNFDGSLILSGASQVLIIPPGPPATIFNNTQILSLDNVTYNASLKTLVIESGRLPEGEYLACVDIKDIGGRTLAANICSMPFTIVYPPSPSLVYPADGDTVLQQYPIFQWTPATAPPSFLVHYALRIVELLPKQEPAQALAANAYPQYEDQNLTSPTLIYPVSGLPLKAGATYAWRVQALDHNNYPATTSNGFSQIFTFVAPGGIPPPPPPPPPPLPPVADCLRLTAGTPENGSVWKSQTTPDFSVSISPSINRAGLSPGRLRVWEMNRRDEPASTVTATVPILSVDFDTSASGITLTMQDSSTSLLAIRMDSTRPDMRFAPVLKKWYMWELNLNFHPALIRADGARCIDSSVASAAYTFQYDTSSTEPEPGACRDVCSVSPPADQVPFSGMVSAGDSIQAGRFTMILSEAQGTGYGLSGKGTIAVPLLNASLAVEFSGIKVNASRQLIEGQITGAQAEGSPLTKDEANGLGTALNLSREKIEAVHTLASSMDRAVMGLTGRTPISLPLGLDNEIGGERYVIGIIGVVFTPTAASLNAAMSYPLPDLGPGVGLGLGARDICFSPGGFGGNGNVTLYLAADIGDRNDDSWSFAFQAPKSGTPGCSVTFDCHGFKQLRVSADVQFPRTWFRPFPTDDGTSKVTASFETVVGRGGNFIASAGMDRCEIAGAPGFVIEVQELTFDKSTEENPEGIVFPAGYTGAKDESWTGFFIKRASISLPPQLRTFDASQPPQLSVNNLLINRSGVTGDFRAENVFMYPQGNFGEWGGSLDTLGIDLVNSSLQRGWMTGRIKMPISETPLRYSATLARPLPADTSRSLNYLFVLQPEDTLSADLWKARISLSPTSAILIGNDNPEKKLVASATLNGSVTIAGDIGGLPHVSFPGVEFQDLRLQTVRPYFTNGTWSFASPEKGLAGFPVSISHISLESAQREGKDLTGLKFTLSINLSPGTSAVSGGTALTLWGELDRSAGGQKFAFHGVELDSIGVNADLGPVKVTGALSFYREDPVFGSGFRGQVRADILKRISVASTLQFGQVSGFRYFYVDARGAFSPGIAFGTTGVGFYGFGGGFWWNMRREGTAQPATPTATVVAADNPGATASGLQFVPSDGSFGFKAMVVLGTYPSPVAFNADLMLEIELQQTSTGVSVGRITLGGNGYMMADLTEREKAKVTCFADITYDFPTSTLHGVFNATINAPPVTGGGQMVVHVEPATWYVKIGEPANRINLSLASWLTTNAYLMLGKNLPPPPPPPQRVLAIIGSPPTNRDGRIAAGNGFALGASVAFSTGRQYYLIFYGDVSAGGGFDIAMLHQTRCAGINGWQAQGQLYAYVDASVGLHVNIGFYVYYPCGPWWCARLCRWCRDGYVGYNGDFEILGIHAAALLEAGGPNPLWFAGTVAGRYSILGGLVKGNCSFKFTKGTECRL